MEMTDNQAREILEHLIAVLKQSGFSDIHNFIVERLTEWHERENLDSPQKEHMKYFLVRYINQLIKQLRQRSREEYNDILGTINKYIIVENDEQIKGLQVSFNENESQLYGIESIDLVKLPDYSILINGLSEIANFIQEDYNNRIQ